ncbi:magnesium/cobalt transporter CorA [Urechidicola croceus]|uniref:Magnesium transport protein CorA n=1 Tax=Urechidicola croceus TaxID=1850246 RepID=A0A1D8PB73_9FLAO|nr:magnesium/cobalt transporter CorA [Urechidicola croceus]AOW21830.1 magnesium and cobalt transport protein CorA [Urechidicola croceus]
MSENGRKTSRKSGLPPGALIHVGSKKVDHVKVSVIDYNEDIYSEKICEQPSDCFEFKDSETVSWINIDGLHDTEVIAKIGNHFDLHSLTIEDVLNTNHRPKIEEFQNHIFITLKMLGISKNKTGIVHEQVSFILGKNWIISFQEQEGDIFDSIRMRLKERKGIIRDKGADYLFYRLIDTVVDNYFYVTDYISDVSEKLEEKILISPTQESLREIQKLKKQLINLRKITNPLREVVSTIEKDANDLIEESTGPYFRDVYEHIIQINDTIETQRDMASSIMDLYLTGVSNKMNEVMKLLTIIATIFIPLTFIAGIYGMNFEHMPELHWKYGYHIAWGIMILITLIMVIYFKKKKWL